MKIFFQIIFLFLHNVFSIFPPEPRCDSILFYDSFNNSTLNPKWVWLNEPKNWSLSAGKLTLYPDPQSDFWSRSYYNFIHDNGHFLYLEIPNSKNYTLYTKLKVYPLHQFDQAGLMSRYSPDSWIKMGIEYGDNATSQLGSVTTNYYSDWATRNVNSSLTQIFYRMAKLGEAWTLHARFNEEEEWEQIRITYLEESEKYQTAKVGIFACAPIQEGGRVEFEHFKLCEFETKENERENIEKKFSEL